MKTIRVTIRKDGKQASCRLEYILTRSPAKQTWSGDRGEFRCHVGLLPNFGFPMEWLEEGVRHQAERRGATFEIEDLGGEATEWRDEVLF